MVLSQWPINDWITRLAKGGILLEPKEKVSAFWDFRNLVDPHCKQCPAFPSTSPVHLTSEVTFNKRVD